MRGLDKLTKMSKPSLRTLAKNAGIKVSVGWTKTVIATKILEKQKLSELEEPEPSTQPEPELEPEPGQSKRKPEFESLASEPPEIAPDSPQDKKDGRGGAREGAGRTSDQAKEKARIDRLLNNEVPDPLVQFVVESVFGLAGEKKKVVEPTPEQIAVPATNLLSYYFPNLRMNPVLQVWFDLLIGSKNLVVSQMEKRKAEPEQPESESPESNDNAK